MLVAEKMMVQGFHYPFPSVAHVEKKNGSGYREDSGAVEFGDLSMRQGSPAWPPEWAAIALRARRSRPCARGHRSRASG